MAIRIPLIPSRPSRYAPMLILVCAATLCRLDYGYACILHMLLQILSLYGLLYWAFGLLGLKRYRLVCLLFINLSLFLTPVGLSWFERGQFSLYVASSYILLILALIKRWPMLVVAAALLAFIKWTSFPAIFVILAVYLLNSRSFAELRDNSLMVALFGVVTVGLVLFPLLLAGGTGGFLKGLMAQELQDSPQGLSLLLYAPRIIVKMLPMVLIILGYVNIQILQGGFEYLIPYILGVTTMMLIYPTHAYDYSVPTLLGFIPLILFWKNLQGAERHVFRDALAYSFFIFLVLASFSTLITHSTLIMVVIYVIFSLALVVSPSVLAGRNFVDRRLPVDAR